MSIQYTDEEIAIYTILNGQKEAAAYLKLTENELQAALSRILQMEEGIPFFMKIREMLLQFQKYLDVEDVSEYFKLSNKVLGLFAIRLEKDLHETIEIIPVNRKRRGEIELFELNLNFKKLKNSNIGSQEYQIQEGQCSPDPISNDEILKQQEDYYQQTNDGKKKRGRKPILQVDQNMINEFKMVQEGTVNTKDLADKYGVSHICIQQIMKKHGYTSSSKVKGKSSVEEGQVYQNEQIIQQPNPNSNKEIVQQQEDNQQVNGGKKKRGRKPILQVDQNMINEFKMVQNEALNHKDLADRYGVSLACIQQVMKKHGYSAPNKTRGRKAKYEQPPQLQDLQNLQTGDVFNENQFNQLPQNNFPNQQVQLMCEGMDLINAEPNKNEEAL